MSFTVVLAEDAERDIEAGARGGRPSLHPRASRSAALALAAGSGGQLLHEAERLYREIGAPLQGERLRGSPAIRT